MKNVRNLREPWGKLARGGVALMSFAALLYVIGCAPSTPGGKTSLVAFRKGDLAQLQLPGAPNAANPKAPQMDPGVEPAAAPPPDNIFFGPDDKPLKIADLKGKLVLVNLWSITCAPCKVEMPTLAALQKAYPDKLQVVALNTDPAEDLDQAKAQMAGVAPLQFYHANGIDIAFALKPEAVGEPTTVIYDKNGVEQARLAGSADWNGKDARALIDHLLAG